MAHSFAKPFCIFAFMLFILPNEECTAQQPSFYVRPQISGANQVAKRADQVIVFVHGVLGDGATTWKSGGSSWPELMATDATYSASDIFVYSYPTSLWATLSIDELAENMRVQLDANGVTQYKRIIFLTHSMGGLVTRAYLLKNRDAASRIAFAYFFSTPTGGSEVAALATLISQSPQFVKMKPMTSENYPADQVRQWLAADMKIPAYCAYEKRKTYGFSIVSFTSAVTLCTKALDPIDTDHLDIVKPADRNAMPYLAFKAAYIREAPSWKTNADAPLHVKLLEQETKPLDGYKFNAAPALPDGLELGAILPAGGRTRIVLQASDSDKIIEIGRITLLISRKDIAGSTKFAYSIDPTKQPGFGAARPRRFIVRIADSNRAEAFYLTDNKQSVKVQLDNILAGTDIPLLRLDRSAGLQETFDLSITTDKPGFYEVRFVAHATSQGNEYALQTQPLYIFRR